jgi:hypothetical protein
MHPAVQNEGEVEICVDSFHLKSTPQNRTEYIERVRHKQTKLRVASRQIEKLTP